MRQLGKFALAFAVVALCALPASAQGQRGQGRGGFGGGFGGGGLFLLTNKSVQEELKLENGQTEKITALGTKNREALRDLSQEQRREKMASIAAENDKEIESILKPEQVKRYRQIENQTAGANALLSERNAEKLKLTDDQKSKVREILTSSREKMGELRGQFQNDREGAMKRIQEIRAETNKSAVGVLTDDQKKTWEELTGAPFEVKFEGNRRPGA